MMKSEVPSGGEDATAARKHKLQIRRGGLADRRFHQSHFRGRSTARNLRAVDNGEYVDKMWIGEDEGSRTPGDTVERLLHLARELIALTESRVIQ